MSQDINVVRAIARRIDKLTARFAQTARARRDAVYLIATEAREDLRALRITWSCEQCRDGRCCHYWFPSLKAKAHVGNICEVNVIDQATLTRWPIFSCLVFK